MNFCVRSSNTWEPLTNLSECLQSVGIYEEQQERLRRSRKNRGVDSADESNYESDDADEPGYNAKSKLASSIIVSDC